MTFPRLRRDSAHFLMIDVQERLLPAISDHEKLHRNILKLERASEVMNIPFCYTEQYPKGLGGTTADIMRALPEGALRFEKNTFSCCDEEGFNDILALQNRPVTVLFGIETHICVLATALDLLEQNRTIVVAADACGSRSPEHSILAMEAMRGAGALVLPVETIIYHIMGRSGTPEFKALLPLFKE